MKDSTARSSLCIFSPPLDLQEGLFGNVFYHTFQVLPYLYKRGIFPAWEIGSSRYGVPPAFTTLPGALDLAYEPAHGPYRRMSLKELRRRHAQVLGNDWAQLHRIWHAYFRIPERIQIAANGILPAGRILGLHFRGNDKYTSLDTSPIQQTEFLSLVTDFLLNAQPFDAIFAATDEFSFIEKLRKAVSIPVINLGEVTFHKSEFQVTGPREKTDRALLDCLLLSRCNCVIQTCSALPSFAKILNPNVEIYRTSASKLFTPNMPYFPVAYIPVIPASTPRAREILSSTLLGDWLHKREGKRSKRQFAYRTYRPLHHALFSIAEMCGLSEIIAAHR